MTYTFRQKILYNIVWLYCKQDWRRTVDDRNRKITSNRLLWLSSCSRLFINNRIQSIIWDVWNLHEFRSDCILFMWLALIWGIVWLVVKKYRTNIKLQTGIFVFSIIILFITCYSYLWQNKKKITQWLKNLMKISEH